MTYHYSHLQTGALCPMLLNKRDKKKWGKSQKKVQERRLKWYGHVMRREEHYVGKKGYGNESTGEKEERKT